MRDLESKLSQTRRFFIRFMSRRDDCGSFTAKDTGTAATYSTFMLCGIAVRVCLQAELRFLKNGTATPVHTDSPSWYFCFLQATYICWTLSLVLIHQETPVNPISRRTPSCFLARSPSQSINIYICIYISRSRSLLPPTNNQPQDLRPKFEHQTGVLTRSLALSYPLIRSLKAQTPRHTQPHSLRSPDKAPPILRMPAYLITRSLRPPLQPISLR